MAYRFCNDATVFCFEIINKEQVMEDSQEYTVPPVLAKILKPIPPAMIRLVTLKQLHVQGYWLLPEITYGGKPTKCPCCSGVHPLAAHGLCGGCYDPAQKKGLSGIALLDHLAKRAKGGKKIRPAGPKKTIKKSTSPVAGPSSPAALPPVAGQVESKDLTMQLHFIVQAIRMSLGLDDKSPLSEIPKHIDDILANINYHNEHNQKVATEYSLVSKILGVKGVFTIREMAERRMAELESATEKVAELTEKIASLNRLLATQPIETTPAPEDAIVAKWSALPIPDGYDSLSDVLTEAINQAAYGKGLERHADHRPFHEQPIMRETEAVGLGHPAGQARKKILEAVRCCQDHPDRAIADLLGAINYTAALVIAIRASIVEQAA